MQRFMLLCCRILGAPIQEAANTSQVRNQLILEAAAAKLVLSLVSWPPDPPGNSYIDIIRFLVFL